jgi:hypothetical protein
MFTTFIYHKTAVHSSELLANSGGRASLRKYIIEMAFLPRSPDMYVHALILFE